MITRRIATALTAAAVVAGIALPASAQDWKAKYPELVFAIVPAENAAGVTERYAPLMAYLSKELGTKVTLRVAQDYAAVIEGQKAGQIHIGYYGPASFARALMTGAKIEAFAQDVNEDGTKGYFSVVWVKKDAPFTKIEDLKGKNLCLVDPNSTSGNNVPRYAMNKMGIDPETFFGKVVYSGSHENAIIGVQQGTCDAAFNWYNDERESNLLRMSRKNMVKADDFKLIFKSDQIVNSPIAVLADMPADLKGAISKAILDVGTKEPAMFDKMFDGKAKPWQPVDNKAFDTIIELNKFVDELRKKRS
ncbi:MAG: phosphonate ABC transporter substrate-binding protein [Hyphomicrobiales bacterium]|nr:phosphonate ABC transporter substrate-binding protein [Hyphomicrobiales bacterium]